MPRNTGPSVRANCERRPLKPARRRRARARAGRATWARRPRPAAGPRPWSWSTRPVGLEQTEAPLPRPDGLEGDAAGPGRQGDPGGVGHVQLGHPGQLLEGDPDERVGIVVLAVVGGDAEGQRAGGLEPVVARSGSRSDDLQQVAEEATHGIVGVSRSEHAHTCMLRGRCRVSRSRLWHRPPAGDREGHRGARAAARRAGTGARPWCAPGAASTASITCPGSIRAWSAGPSGGHRLTVAPSAAEASPPDTPSQPWTTLSVERSSSATPTTRLAAGRCRCRRPARRGARPPSRWR